jgi:plastocyanin
VRCRAWAYAALVAAAAVPGTASAATLGISGRDDGGLLRFDPGDSSGAPGDTASWSFATAVAPHNVNLVPPGVSPDDTTQHELIGTATPGQAAPFTKVLDKPGTWLFYCSFHGGLAPGGMSGRITIVKAGDPPPPPPPPVATGPKPDPNTTPAFSGLFEEGDFIRPGLSQVGALATGRTVRVRYVTTEPGTVAIAFLDAKKKVAKSVVLAGRRAGVNTVKVKNVKPGRYSVLITAADLSGLESATAKRRVTVAASRPRAGRR